MRILTVFGTRPEAIKLAPLVRALSDHPSIEHSTCVTGQHREMLDQVLAVFGIRPDHDLRLMKPGQDLGHITSAVLNGVGAVLDRVRPDLVIVQGDTASAFAAALAAFHRRIDVAHVEAGLRTGNRLSPWPEETNRSLITRIASLHFAPTPAADRNLCAEGIPLHKRLMTGNTVIDALQWVVAKIRSDAALRERCERRFAFLDRTRRLILVTAHRRENHDGGLERVFRALVEIARRRDIELICPVHPNPAVQAAAGAILTGHPTIHLVPPLDYVPFVYLMQRAHLIVTDSGGIQEEAPALGKPVLVIRGTTERPEAVAAGTARLVGTETAALTAALTELLDDARAYAAMAQAHNPFGDGRASERIVGKLLEASERSPAAPSWRHVELI